MKNKFFWVFLIFFVFPFAVKANNVNNYLPANDIYNDTTIVSLVDTVDGSNNGTLGGYTAEECRKLVLGEELAEILDNIFTFILIAVPILTIVLIIKDMVSAVAASKEEDMKKAQKNAIFRIIIAVAICLLPVIVNTVLNLVGFTSGTCGIG